MIIMIRNKLIALGIPYVVFSIVFVVMQQVAGNAHEMYTFHDLLFIYDRSISYLWFLYALFFIFVVNYFLDLLHFSESLKFLVSVVLFALQYAVTLPYFAAVTFTWMICFNFGRVLERDGKWFENTGVIAILSFAALLALCIQYFQGGAWFDTNTITPANMISKLACVPIIIFFFRHANNNKINDYFAKFGKDSLVIYLVHAPVASMIRSILMRVHVTNYFLLILLITVITWAICVIAIILAKNTNIVKLVFYPRAWYKTWRKHVSEA